MHKAPKTRALRVAAWLVLSIGVLATPAGSGAPDRREYAVRPTESTVRIHVGTSGLLGFLGHEHLVEAPVARGRVVWDPVQPERSIVELEFDTTTLAVIDPELDADRRARIQAEMSGTVLEVERYPTIRFVATRFRIEGAPDGGSLRGTVEGTLGLHGVDAALDVSVEVVVEDGELRARGVVRFKASRFGIERVSAGAGTVKTRDLLELTFDVVARPGDPSRTSDSDGPHAPAG